jgi:hypothetical protein
MIILSWSDRSGHDDFHSGFDSPDDDVLPGKHIVWGDEAKPLVLIRELAALLNGCRPHPQNSLAALFPLPVMEKMLRSR